LNSRIPRISIQYGVLENATMRNSSAMLDWIDLLN
jgi:hypothetical protein